MRIIFVEDGVRDLCAKVVTYGVQCMRRGPLAICKQCRPRSAFAFALADQGLFCPLVLYVEDQRSRLDCMDVQADQGLHCPH